MMPFNKGQSGNPSGRPRGVPNRLAKYRELAAMHLPDVIEKLVDMAMAGDIQAAKILIDMVVPRPRPVAQPVAFELEEGSLSAAGRSILQSAARGVLAPEQAHALLQALSQQARLAEIDEFEQRLRVLEEQLPHAS